MITRFGFGNNVSFATAVAVGDINIESTVTEGGL
jgi:hypothetical protein